MSAPALQLRDFWYIAGQSGELRSRPIARTLLGERVVLFRQADGTPAALQDRCAHRNAALSEGRVEAGCVECPYHGWTYSGDGRCTVIPSMRELPAEPIRIPAFPSLEQDGFVWVYLGDAP